VETECHGRLRLLNAARHELESFDAGVNGFDSWLCGAESQLRIMQRSVGDLHKFRQQTTDLQVRCAYCTQLCQPAADFSTKFVGCVHVAAKLEI